MGMTFDDNVHTVKNNVHDIFKKNSGDVEHSNADDNLMARPITIDDKTDNR